MQDETPNQLRLTAADLFPASKRDIVSVPDVYQSYAARNDDSAYQTPRPKPVARIMPKPQVTNQGPAQVLHVRVVTGCGGGPEKTILRSPRYADPNRYQMAAAYIYPQGDPGMCVIREIAKSLKCPLYEVSESHALDHNTIGAMIELCRDLKVDIWHGHDYKSNLFGLIVKRFHPMKLVTTAHGFTRETWRTRLYYHLDNLAMLGYDRAIAVSPQLVKHCACHGVNPDRLSYIPNAIDTAEYVRTQSTGAAKAEFGLPRDKYTIGVIGRFSPEKGTDRAIRMLPELLAKHPNTELHLIGDGHERGALQQLATQLGVSDTIRWWGWQTDTRPFYEMLDALLLPSRTEGLPNVVLEAMAMGVPVAATNVGGVSDLLDHGDCGIILTDDETDWARQIAPLLSIPTLRESYADLANRRVSGAFNFRNRIRAVMSVYDEVLGRLTPNANQSTGTDREARLTMPTRLAA
ncbi:MAG: glycosyltransferase family 4 protein [Phycisphaerales bacterium]